MLKGWLENLEKIKRVISVAVAKTINFFTQNERLSHWRPISTAPFNQELELRIAEDGSISTLEIPCLQTNEGVWIDVDLGTEIHINPVEWRVWLHGASPRAHHKRIRVSDRSDLLRLHGDITYKDITGDE